MKVIGKITLLEPLTQGKIDELIATDGVVGIQVERNYAAGDVPGVIALVVPSGVEGGFLDAFKEVVDESSWLHEESSFVFTPKWKTPENIIDLTDSYVRDQKDTSSVGPMEGKAYTLTFSVPGFGGLNSVSCDMVWGISIAPGEIAKAKTLGLDISGTGASIHLNAVPSSGFMVAFEKAAGETGTYIFDDENLKNKTLL